MLLTVGVSRNHNCMDKGNTETTASAVQLHLQVSCLINNIACYRKQQIIHRLYMAQYIRHTHMIRHEAGLPPYNIVGTTMPSRILPRSNQVILMSRAAWPRGGPS